MIFIPGEVPSSKNSKIKTNHGVFNSVAVRKYLKFIGVKKYSCKNGVECYKRRPNIFNSPGLREEFWNVSFPVSVGVHFVRQTKRRFDFINLCQIIQDLLVAHKIIPDDDINNLDPVLMLVNGNRYTVDKERPGVYLHVLTDNEFKLPNREVRRQ